MVIDLLVPARLASRYRARLTTLSRVEGRLQLAFCPSVFRSGSLADCPAEVSLVAGAFWVRLRGLLEMDGGDGTTGRIRFDQPLRPEDFEGLRRACRLEDDALADVGGGTSPGSLEQPAESIADDGDGALAYAASLH